jgi:O-acetyl-ADP-ribose deacetylase (regulator of RNase III)
MSVKFVAGDLFALELPAVGHGCNCMGFMEAGIARTFKKKYPNMFEMYRRKCARAQFKLGDVFPWEVDPTHYIFNLATQKGPGVPAELPAIKKSVQKMLKLCETMGLEKVGVPRIGAGLGKLRWEDVKGVLQSLGEESCAELLVFEE